MCKQINISVNVYSVVERVHTSCASGSSMPHSVRRVHTTHTHTDIHSLLRSLSVGFVEFQDVVLNENIIHQIHSTETKWTDWHGVPRTIYVVAANGMGRQCQQCRRCWWDKNENLHSNDNKRYYGFIAIIAVHSATLRLLCVRTHVSNGDAGIFTCYRVFGSLN